MGFLGENERPPAGDSGNISPPDEKTTPHYRGGLRDWSPRKELEDTEPGKRHRIRDMSETVKVCPHCGAELKAESCPSCGWGPKREAPDPQRSGALFDNEEARKVLAFALGLLGCGIIPGALIGVGIGFLEDGKVGVAVALFVSAAITLGLSLYAFRQFHLEVPDLPGPHP